MNVFGHFYFTGDSRRNFVINRYTTMERFVIICTLLLFCILAEAQEDRNKCDIPPSAPKRIENAINECQEEIKVAILSEALETLKVNEHSRSRSKRATFSDDERRIAGCLLQCVYRKTKAVNRRGFPTLDGLVNLYTDGIEQRGYVLATVDAVNVCLQRAERKHLLSLKSLEEHGKTCDIAYDVFECVSDEIGNYCGQSP